MRCLVISGVLTSSLLLSFASATPGTIQWGIVKKGDIGAARLRRRGKTVTAILDQTSVKDEYNVNLTVGTPQQPIAVQVDTGSSDVWFPDSSACTALSTGGTTCDGGSFNHSRSSSFVNLHIPFSIGYADGTGATGVYFNDTLRMGSATIQNFQMGLALNTTTNTGLIGIGYDSNEGGVDYGGVKEHPGFVDALVSNGFISTTAYSLWLDDLQANTGLILFGGIDTAKYIGHLLSVNVYPSPTRPGTNITEFLVALTSISMTSSSGSDLFTPSNYALGVVLDSGSSIMTLPADIVALIYREFAAVNSTEYGPGIVPCSAAQNSGTLNFGFGGPGGPTIEIPMSELIDPVFLGNGETAVSPNGSRICSLGVTAQDPSDTGSLTFGDTFLRSAYVVYDMYNDQIAIAQTIFNSTTSNVVAFESLGAAIPSASKATGQASITPVATAPALNLKTLAAASGLQKGATSRGREPLDSLQVIISSLWAGI